MKYKHIFFKEIFFCFFILVFSCTGSPEPASPNVSLERPDAEKRPGDPFYSVQPDMVFVPGEFPSLEIMPGVGVITGDRMDRAASLSEREKIALSRAFMSAYVDGLLRELDLAGVLGGDLVHNWPAGSASAWVQNWSSSAPQANSWGLSPLVLAVRGFGEGPETSGDRVFIVRGKVLDQYGKNGGINRANGNAGYGSPLGYEFFYEGKIAQRFDFGLITVDLEGKSAFLAQNPPSRELEIPPEAGVFRGTPTEEHSSAFKTAWKMAVDRNIGAMIPDGAGQYLSFSEISGDFPGGHTLKGLYVQSFNRRSVLLVLPDSSVLPPYARIIAAPFIDVLLSPKKNPVLGGENLKALELKSNGADDFYRALLGGFALYGIPLSDPIPVKAEAPETGWQLAQRFSRGWIMGPPGRLR